jgi:hypothetical protein
MPVIETKKFALLSACGKYRYTLARWWRPMLTLPDRWALWIMLNPSTADDTDDDRTIENIVERTHAWTYPAAPDPSFHFRHGVGVHVANLYAFRSTDPLRLLDAEDPIGPENDEHLQVLIARCQLIVCAWGNGPWKARRNPIHANRVSAVVSMIRAAGKVPMMLNLTNAGMPRHPLYFPMRRDPIPYVYGCIHDSRPTTWCGICYPEASPC